MRGRILRFAVITVFVLGVPLPDVWAQTTTLGAGTVTIDIKADFDVDYVYGETLNTYGGTGTIDPFGPATIQATYGGTGPLTLTFTFLNGAASILVGDFFQVTGVPSSGGLGSCSIASGLTGGAGVFSNASGTLNLYYACSPDAPPAGSFRLSGTGNLTLTIAVDDSCQANSGSPATTSCANQAIAIDPPIVGTPFELHYQSERVPGRSGASGFLTSFARDLGGWTLNARHAYDPVSGNLYLGSGGRRRGAMLGLPLLVSGNYLIADEGGTEVYVFDRTGRHLRTMQALTGGLIYEFRYDTTGHLSGIADFAGNVTVFQRDAGGNPTAIVGPYGQRTAITVNSDGYISQITNPSQERINLTYAAGGLLATFTDAQGNTDKFQYDSKGLLTRADHAGGASETLVSRAGSPSGITSTTGAGVTTTYFADLSTHGQEARTITSASGAHSSMQSSANAFSVSPPDGTKVQAGLGADPRWGIQAPVVASASVTTPSGNQSIGTETRSVTLNNGNDPFSASSLTDTVTINGRRSTATYDGATRTLTSLSPAGRTTSTTLDSRGRITWQQMGSFDPASFTYDDHGRLNSLTLGSGSATASISVGYNSQGYVSTMTDPTHRVFGLEYDLSGRITKLSPPQGTAILYSYDAKGELTSLTPPGRNPHTFTYSASGRIAAYSPPAIDGVNAQTTFSYDADGRVTRVQRGDQTIDIGSDNSGRRSALNLPTGTISYTYDAATERLVGISGPGDSGISLQYDGALLVRETWTGPVSGTVSNTFDNNFFLVAQSLNGGTPIAFQYNGDGLLAQAGALRITRDTQTGLLTATAIDNIADAFGYDSLGQQASYSATTNGTALYSVRYVRDLLGRIAQRAETIQGVTDTYAYTYDTIGQLIGVAKDAAMTASYSYDANGNRLSATVAEGLTKGQYDAQDRLIGYGTFSFAYRDDGQLLARSDGQVRRRVGHTRVRLDDGQLLARSDGQATTQYRYDALGNLLGVTLADGKRIRYLLDGTGRRLGKSVNGSILHGWLYRDGLRPVAELDGSNNVVSTFVYVGSGAPAYMAKNGTNYRIIADERGSPRLVVETVSGAVAQRLDYDEFGNVLQDTNPGFQPFGFAGGLYDSDTGLVHFGARDYDPHLGRWTAKDPILFASGDTNLYAYVANDPVNLEDASGLTGVGDWVAAVGTNCSNKAQQAWDKIDEWVKSKVSKGCVDGLCISTDKPEISVGGTIGTGDVNGQTVVSVTGEAGAGITSTQNLRKPMFYWFVKIGAKVGWLSKGDVIDAHGEFFVPPPLPMSNSQIIGNQCDINECYVK